MYAELVLKTISFLMDTVLLVQLMLFITELIIDVHAHQAFLPMNMESVLENVKQMKYMIKLNNHAAAYLDQAKLMESVKFVLQVLNQQLMEMLAHHVKLMKNQSMEDVSVLKAMLIIQPEYALLAHS